MVHIATQLKHELPTMVIFRVTLHNPMAGAVDERKYGTLVTMVSRLGRRISSNPIHARCCESSHLAFSDIFTNDESGYHHRPVLFVGTFPVHSEIE